MSCCQTMSPKSTPVSSSAGGCCCQQSSPAEEAKKPSSANGCCCSSSRPAPVADDGGSGWNARYFAVVAVLAGLWWLAYSVIQPVSSWLVFGAFGLEQGSALGEALEFFFYDTAKILLLLALLLYVIAWLRAALNVERIRDMLAGKKRSLGYALGAMFGSVTPFCSCSSIPLFLGFSSAGIPIGITMSFLITSPLINEVAVVLLWNLLDWKFTILYVAVGIGAGIIGGFVMDALRAGRWLQPFVLEAIANAATPHTADDTASKLTVRQRHLFAWYETTSLFRRVWHWVIIGVAVGATLHGVVPENWFAQNFGAGEWWTVPAAVLLGIPLYTSVTGIVPIMESLLVKGLPIGTTMAFCMSSVVASIPGLIMLRQIMTTKLLAVFIGYLWVVFTLAGWLFNAGQAYLL